jgi:hypothetical protein
MAPLINNGVTETFSHLTPPQMAQVPQVPMPQIVLVPEVPIPMAQVLMVKILPVQVGLLLEVTMPTMVPQPGCKGKDQALHFKMLIKLVNKGPHTNHPLMVTVSLFNPEVPQEILLEKNSMSTRATVVGCPDKISPRCSRKPNVGFTKKILETYSQHPYQSRNSLQ